MEAKEGEQENFCYYYDKEERLCLKRKGQNKRKNRKLLGFPFKGNSFILLNLLLVMFVVFLFQRFTHPSSLNKHLPYSASIKEILWEEKLMIEIKLKSCSQKSECYRIWAQNSISKSKIWSGTLSVNKQEILYLSLPDDQQKNYTVWIERDSEPALALLRRI